MTRGEESRRPERNRGPESSGAVSPFSKTDLQKLQTRTTPWVPNRALEMMLDALRRIRVSWILPDRERQSANHLEQKIWPQIRP